MKKFLRLLSGQAKIKNILIKSLVLFFFFSVAFRQPTFIGHAVAAASARLAIYPTRPNDPNDPLTTSWFIYEVRPGQSIESEVTVENKSNQSAQAGIYAVDATSTSDGAFTLKAKGTKEDAGAWIKIGGFADMAPKSKGSLPFKIVVPSNASPGDHVAGIAVEIKESDEKLQTSGVKVIQRVGVRVYLNVQGERRENLSIKSARTVQENGSTFIKYSLENTGNTNLDLEGQLLLKTILGTQSLNLGNLGQILAGKQVEGRVKVESLNPLAFMGQLKIVYADQKTTSKDLFVINRLQILLLLPLIFLGFFSLRWFKNKL